MLEYKVSIPILNCPNFDGYKLSVNKNLNTLLSNFNVKKSSEALTNNGLPFLNFLYLNTQFTRSNVLSNHRLACFLKESVKIRRRFKTDTFLYHDKS